LPTYVFKKAINLFIRMIVTFFRAGIHASFVSQLQ